MAPPLALAKSSPKNKIKKERTNEVKCSTTEPSSSVDIDFHFDIFLSNNDNNSQCQRSKVNKLINLDRGRTQPKPLLFSSPTRSPLCNTIIVLFLAVFFLRFCRSISRPSWYSSAVVTFAFEIQLWHDEKYSEGKREEKRKSFSIASQHRALLFLHNTTGWASFLCLRKFNFLFGWRWTEHRVQAQARRWRARQDEKWTRKMYKYNNGKKNHRHRRCSRWRSRGDEVKEQQ